MPINQDVVGQTAIQQRPSSMDAFAGHHRSGAVDGGRLGNGYFLGPHQPAASPSSSVGVRSTMEQFGASPPHQSVTSTVAGFLGDSTSSTATPTPSRMDGRRSNKPVMEKRRRARINSCLGELKNLILNATKKDPSRHSKLEKADILEMTVKHLQNVQRAQLAIAVASDPRVLARFKNGFAECATEASRYVARIDGADPGLKTRMATHLTACVSGLQSLTPLAFTAMAAPSLAAVDVNIPTATLLQRAAMHSGHQMVDAAASGVVPAGPGEALPTGASPGASLAAKQDMAKRDLTPQEQIAVLHHHTLGTQRPIFPRAISPHAVTEDGRRRHSSDDAATDDDDDMSDYSDFEESPVVKKRGKLSSAPRREACLGATPLTRGHPVVIRQEASSSSSTPQKDVSRPVFPRPSAFTAVHVPQRQGPAFAVPEDLTTKPKLVTPIVLLRASDDKDSPAAAGFVTAKKKFPSEPTLSPAAPAKIKNESRRSDGDEKVVASGEQRRGSDNMWRPW